MSLYGRLKLLEIKRMLKAKYNQKVYNKDLYKVIYKHHKTKAQESNDMSRLLVYLENCKENDSQWIIFKDWDHKINTLTKIFWMIPKQIETWCRYSDVIINDNTAKTNRYEMALSCFVAIDSNMKSRIVAQALIDRETKDAYIWLLQCILDATELTPKVFITDADPRMDIVIHLKYPSIFHIHCIWHIKQNLHLCLKSKLGALFELFKRESSKRIR
ncbi:unnamed protein product [Rhizophagus irregularis]|nr:unnamed protein product [Rhizophagus irregularis]